MMIWRWLKEKPIIDIYRIQLKVCRVSASITGLFTFACLMVNAPAVSTVPWAVMFGISTAAWPLLTLLIETQKQIDEEMEWHENRFK